MSTYQAYIAHLSKVADIVAAATLMGWDKEVNLPSKGAAIRAQQMATIEGIAHEQYTSAAFGTILNELAAQADTLTERERKNVFLSLRDYEQSSKFSTAFVMRNSQAVSAAFHAWIKAREANDFSLFQAALKDLIAIKREAAEILGYEAHPYDALMDQYEAGMTVAKLDVLFADVKQKLVQFVKEIKQKPLIKNDFLRRHFPKDKQWQFGLDLLKNMGYDFEAGRQDISTHPFTTNFAPTDVRVTTRIDENDLANMVWSCIHEGGHGLYEQGLPIEEYGTPLGAATSLGIHESQSRLWENNVGRSLRYWEHHYPHLQSVFPEALGDISVTDFYKGINRIAPNFIRTEADELHYHFHIMIRYEIEKGLIEGSIEVDEQLPALWNSKYKEYMGIDVPDDKRGILQDVHWAHGIQGYFPTYSLGSFYAAQFFHQACVEIPTLKEEIKAGNNASLLAWLREKVHRHGRFYTSEELCEHITGEPLNFQYFMEYVTEKYGVIYS